MFLYFFDLTFPAADKDYFLKKLVSLSEKENAAHGAFFIDFHKLIESNIGWMINWNVLKFSYIYDFYNKIVCRV